MTLRHVALPLFVLVGCGNAPPANDGPPLDRLGLLSGVGSRVLVTTNAAFDTAADVLAGVVPMWCQALDTGDEAARHADSQEAWRRAMRTWQRAESVLIGPAAMNSWALRDRIYSWPLVSSCAVDQEVMVRWSDPAAFDISTRLTNRRGLAALEYLLFNASLATTCPPQAAPAGWDALSDADKRRARCAYAEDAAEDLAVHAQLLVDAWAPGKGAFLGQLTSSGSFGGAYPTAHEGMNAISDSMFYVDHFVKDMKLGEPAGISPNRCGSVEAACASELESPWARHSLENIVENLRGLQMTFHARGPDGSDAVGFDDLLRAAGAPDLADVMTADIEAAIAAAEAVGAPLEEAIHTRREAVVAAHAAVKKVTDHLKTRFLTVLALEIPDDAAADND